MSTLSTRPQEFTRDVGGHMVPVPGVYAIDAAHTMVEFAARQLVLSKVVGRFNEFAGTITVAETLTDSHTEVSIRSASVDTGDARRDEHLRSADFMDSKMFPTIEFCSTGLELDALSGRWRLTGDLMVHGRTHPVELSVLYLGAFGDPWGGQRIAFEASGEINREQWGLTYNQSLDNGGLLVSKKIRLDLSVTALYKVRSSEEA